MAKAFDPQIIKAEENLLIDCHFLIQEMMSEKGVTRSQLAEKAGISKARLSQMLSAEANPTLKSVARIVHALGESVSVTRKPLSAPAMGGTGPMGLPKAAELDWSWEKRKPAARPVDDELVAVIKGESASNDNYPRILFMDSELPLAPEPEPEAQAA
ncbi:MAG TPA: helix-turn-helix transcriptional regulator [Bradyrhizobium sp.]|jgi:DNA-binding phage protein